MNAENFKDYLNDPSLLYQVPYEELKSLALEYPYNAHLRWLLLEKSRMDHRPDIKKALAKAAVYSIDRRVLYHFIQKQYAKTDATHFAFNEDFLELKDLSAIKEEMPAPVEETAIPRKTPLAEPILPYRETPAALEADDHEEDFTFDFSLQTPALDETEEAIAREIAQAEETTAVVEEARSELAPNEPEALEFLADEPQAIDLVEAEPEIQDEPVVEAIAMPDAVAEEPLAEAVDPAAEAEYRAALAAAEAVLQKAAQFTAGAPMPKSSFGSWPRSSAPQPQVLHAPQSPPAPVAKPEKKLKKEDVVSTIARQSVTENTALISETLADLLAAQQQIDKAIKMYERLILKFPKKSAYFASKIEKLKKK